MGKLFLLTIAFCLILQNKAAALDEVRVEAPLSKTDKRTLYKNSIIRAALEASTEKFGPYKLATESRIISHERAKRVLPQGKLINVYITNANREWEKLATPIPLPIRKGIPGLRLLLIHKDDAEQFGRITTLEQLKKFTAGSVGKGDVTKSLLNAGFRVESSSSFDGTFHMLSKKRSDFIPRGINEVYREMASGLAAFEDIVIAPNIILHLPIVSYLFVSPKHPRLAERFTLGLKAIIDNGIFDKLFEKYHGKSLVRADLKNRRVIYIENPNLPASVPFSNKNLWVPSVIPRAR